jgi:hypothetical protein
MGGINVEVCWFEDDTWSGYVPAVRRDWMLGEGVLRTWVAGLSHHPGALTDLSFAPGSPLAICAEPDNPHDPLAVGVWNATRTVCGGYVPRHIADLMHSLSVDRCGVVLSEQTEEGVRANLGILVSREPITLQVVPSSGKLADLVERVVRKWKARFAESHKHPEGASMDLTEALLRSIDRTKRPE